VRARFVVPFFAIVTTVVMIAVAARLDADSGHPKTGSGNREAGLTGIHKIQHVIFIVQENRSFDNYFGTYPGADGIPRKDGRFTVCVPIRGRTRASGPSTIPTTVTSEARTAPAP